MDENATNEKWSKMKKKYWKQYGVCECVCVLEDEMNSFPFSAHAASDNLT